MLQATSPAAAAADVLLAALLLLLLLQQTCASCSAVALAAAAAAVLHPLLRLAVLPQLLWQQVVFLKKVRVVVGHLCEPRQDCTAMWLLAAGLLAQTNTLGACTAAKTRIYAHAHVDNMHAEFNWLLQGMHTPAAHVLCNVYLYDQ
jgi:hypothetical protein